MMTKVSGKGKFFGFNNEGYMIMSEVSGTRVAPTEIKAKILSIKGSGPIYIESRNYFSLPHQKKGLLVTFQLPCDMIHWNLAVINKIYSNQQCIELLVWIGAVEEFGGKIYPQFFIYPMTN